MQIDPKSVVEQFRAAVGSWKLPPGVEIDDIVSEAMLAFLKRLDAGKQVHHPFSWLLGAARNKKRELTRNRWQLASTEQLTGQSARSTRRRHIPLRLELSEAWVGLTPSQKFTLCEAVMHGRPVAEVAQELKQPRSTVKSWVARLPARLSRDPHFLMLRDYRSN